MGTLFPMGISLSLIYTRPDRVDVQPYERLNLSGL